MAGIVELAIARQLIGLLPVLAAALAVALTGHAAVAGEPLARLSERQHEDDEREHIVHAVALLLGAAAGERHQARRAPAEFSDLLDLLCGDPGNALDAIR